MPEYRLGLAIAMGWAWIEYCGIVSNDLNFDKAAVVLENHHKELCNFASGATVISLQLL